MDSVFDLVPTTATEEDILALAEKLKTQAILVGPKVNPGMFGGGDEARTRLSWQEFVQGLQCTDLGDALRSLSKVASLKDLSHSFVAVYLLYNVAVGTIDHITIDERGIFIIGGIAVAQTSWEGYKLFVKECLAEINNH